MSTPLLIHIWLLENFRPGLYDPLLIDVTMPKMDGFELIPESEVLMTESKYVS